MHRVPSIDTDVSIETPVYGRDILDFSYVMPSDVGYGSAIASFNRDCLLNDATGHLLVQMSRAALHDFGVVYRACDLSRPFRVTRGNRALPPNYWAPLNLDDPHLASKRKTDMQAAFNGRASYVGACSIPYGEQCVPSLEMPFNSVAECGRVAFGECLMDDPFFIPTCLLPFSGRWFNWCGSSVLVEAESATEIALLSTPAPDLVILERHTIQVVPRNRKFKPINRLDFSYLDTNSHSRKCFDLHKRASVVLCAQLTTIEAALPSASHKFLVGERGFRADCVHVELETGQWYALNWYLNGILRAHRNGVKFNIGLVSDLLTLLYEKRIHFAPCLNMAIKWLDNATLSPLGDVVHPQMSRLDYQPKILVS